jgi:hypothetical protein
VVWGIFLRHKRTLLFPFYEAVGSIFGQKIFCAIYGIFSEKKRTQKKYCGWDFKGKAAWVCLPGKKRKSARMRGDVLRAMMRTAPFTPMHARSDEERTKLAVGAAVLTIAVVGGALFFMKGTRKVSAFESLKVTLAGSDAMASRIAALTGEIEVLQKQADQGALDKSRASALQAELVAVQSELALEKAELKDKGIAISNHASQLAQKVRELAAAASATDTAELGKDAADQSATELTARLLERDSRINALQDELSKRGAAGAHASATDNENKRLTAENEKLKTEAAGSAAARTAAIAAQGGTETDLRNAQASLKLAEDGQTRLKKEIEALAGIQARLEAAGDENSLAKIKIGTLTALNEDLNEQIGKLASVDADLRAAVESNKLLMGQADALSEANAALIVDLEVAKQRVRDLEGIAKTVETLRSVVKKVGDASDASIRAAHDSKLDASAQKLRADTLKQWNDALSAALGEVGGVIRGQDKELLSQLQRHYTMMNGFVALYDQSIADLAVAMKELAKEQANSEGARQTVAWNQQNLDALSVRVKDTDARLLENDKRVDSAVSEEAKKNAATAETLKKASASLLLVANDDIKRLREDLAIQKASSDKTVFELRDGIKELEKLKTSEALVLTDERVAHALLKGKVIALEQELVRVMVVNDNTSNIVFDLSHNAGVSTQKLLTIEDAKSSVAQEALSAQMQADNRFAAIVGAFSQILNALRVFTQAAGDHARARNFQPVPPALTATFDAAVDVAITAITALGGGATFPTLAKEVFSESLTLTVEAIDSFSAALIANGNWKVAYDSDVQRASQALLYAQTDVARLDGMYTAALDAATALASRKQGGVKKAKTALKLAGDARDAALLEVERGRAALDAASGLALKVQELGTAANAETAAQAARDLGHRKSLGDVIMLVSTPTRIIAQFPADLIAKLAEASSSGDVSQAQPISRETAEREKARRGLSMLAFEAQIKILLVSNNDRVGLLRQSLELAVRGACAAAGVECVDMPKQLTENGLRELQTWMDKTMGAILPVLSTVKPQSSMKRPRPRFNGEEEEEGGPPKGEMPVRDATTAPEPGSMEIEVVVPMLFGVVADANRRVTQFDFLGAFLGVQRMVLMTAMLQARLRTIEATAGMTPAMTPVRFGRRMRRAYV